MLDTNGEPLEPTTVYVETFGARMYNERADTVARCQEVHERVSRVALSVVDSRHLLRKAAKEFSP